MTRETETTFSGRWRCLANLSTHRTGSIHDDAQARSLGYRGGFVPGSTVAEAAMPGVLAVLGDEWMTGGWYTLTFVAPVYVDEEVREVVELDQGDAAVKVVTRDERLCCAGRAGLGYRLPWRPELDGTRGAEGVFPAVPIGASLGTLAFTVSAADVRPMLDSAGDDTPWYSDVSPWGGALVPPEWLHRVARELSRNESDQPRLPFTGIRPPGMWAEHDLAIAEPLFQGRPYVMREWVADKGVSGRTLFVTYQFEVSEGERVVAVGRHKSKWFPATS